MFRLNGDEHVDRIESRRILLYDSIKRDLSKKINSLFESIRPYTGGIEESEGRRAGGGGGGEANRVATVKIGLCVKLKAVAASS